MKKGILHIKLIERPGPYLLLYWTKLGLYWVSLWERKSLNSQPCKFGCTPLPQDELCTFRLCHLPCIWLWTHICTQRPFLYLVNHIFPTCHSSCGHSFLLPLPFANDQLLDPFRQYLGVWCHTMLHWTPRHSVTYFLHLMFPQDISIV